MPTEKNARGKENRGGALRTAASFKGKNKPRSLQGLSLLHYFLESPFSPLSTKLHLSHEMHLKLRPFQTFLGQI